jgi:hypothetical protein
MHPMRSVIASLSLAALLFVPIVTHADQTHPPAQAKPLKKCPKGYSKHKDAQSALWCMDSSGKSYTPQNAAYTAKAAKAAPDAQKYFRD